MHGKDSRQHPTKEEIDHAQAAEEPARDGAGRRSGHGAGRSGGSIQWFLFFRRQPDRRRFLRCPLHGQSRPGLGTGPWGTLRRDGDVGRYGWQRLRAGWRAGHAALAASSRRAHRTGRCRRRSTNCCRQRRRSIRTRCTRCGSAPTTSSPTSSAAAAGQITPAQVQANVVTAATQTLQQIARLRDAGARTIMVFNLPDIGSTPLGRSQPTAPLTALSKPVQFDAAGGTRFAQRRHHPDERERLARGGDRQPRPVRLHQRHHAGVHDREFDHLHPGDAGRAERGADLPVRRQRASDARGPPDHFRLCRGA